MSGARLGWAPPDLATELLAMILAAGERRLRLLDVQRVAGGTPSIQASLADTRSSARLTVIFHPAPRASRAANTTRKTRA